MAGSGIDQIPTGNALKATIKLVISTFYRWLLLFPTFFHRSYYKLALVKVKPACR